MHFYFVLWSEQLCHYTAWIMAKCSLNWVYSPPIQGFRREKIILCQAVNMFTCSRFEHFNIWVYGNWLLELEIQLLERAWGCFFSSVFVTSKLTSFWNSGGRSLVSSLKQHLIQTDTFVSGDWLQGNQIPSSLQTKDKTKRNAEFDNYKEALLYIK